jgi:DNA-binding LacI/PurR family transcriptional regulator
MKRRITLKDLSEKLTISQNTVSLVLRGRPGISDETREAVLKAAAEMGYEGPRKTGTKTAICIVTPYAGGPATYYYGNYQQEIENSLQALGFSVFTINSSSFRHIDAMREMFSTHETKGIVIAGNIGRPLVEQLMTLDIPIVCASFHIPSLALDFVMEDDYTGIIMAVDEVKKRGYRRFGFIGGLDDSSFFSRLMALKAALYKEDLVLLKEAVITEYSQAELCNIETIIPLLKRIKTMPDVFFCGNDKIAMAAIHAMNDMQYKVPQDIGSAILILQRMGVQPKKWSNCFTL